jgi:acetyl esterase
VSLRWRGPPRALANRARSAVLAAEYRLAPEHCVPAALEDVWAAAVWASQAFAQVAVGGDRAGGNPAAAVALSARDRAPGLALQLLVYALVDYGVETSGYYRFRQEYAEFAGSPGCVLRRMITFATCGRSTSPTRSCDCNRRPLRCRAESLRGAPAAVVITAEHDIVRLDGRQYARWVQAEGVPVELHDYAG